MSREECLMKTHSQITFASLAFLIAGSSLLYTTSTLIVKAERTQNISSSLQTSTQRDRTSIKQCGIHCILGTRGYSLKFLKVEKRRGMPLGERIGALRNK